MSPSTTPNQPPRTLLHIPIVHSQADMGAVGRTIRQQVVRASGARAWQRKVEAVDRVWDRIDRAIRERLRPPMEAVRVYQDGLPVCGREEEIVRELAEAGSRNHRLVLRLMAAGARLVGTESAPLLLREYEMAKQQAAAGDASGRRRAAPGGADAYETLLRERDAFIGGRINTTLRPGETGILFLGMLHRRAHRLDRDIRVDDPVGPAGG